MFLASDIGKEKRAMKIINATPPECFPEQVIVMDRDAAVTKGRSFYLRISLGGATVVDLDGTVTLPDAVGIALARGYKPTHWMETTDVSASIIPESIRRAAH